MCTSYSCKNSWTELMEVIKTRDLPLTNNFQDESALASDEGGFQHIGAKVDISRDLEAQWRDILADGPFRPDADGVMKLPAGFSGSLLIFSRGEEYPKSLEPESLTVKIGVNSIAFPDVNRVVSDRILSALDRCFWPKCWLSSPCVVSLYPRDAPIISNVFSWELLIVVYKTWALVFNISHCHGQPT